MKHMTVKINKLVMMIVRSFFTLITLIPFLFFSPFIIPSLHDGLIILLIGIIGAVAYYYFVKAIELSDVSVISAITRTSAVVTVLLSVIFLGEKLQFVQYIAIAVIIIGVILLSLDIKKINGERILCEKKGLFLSFFVLFLWGIMYFLMKYSVDSVGVIYTTFYLEFFVLFWIALLLFQKKHCEDFKSGIEQLKIEKKLLFFLAVIGCLTALGSLFYSYAISFIYVSIAIVISNISPLITAIIAKIFIQERLSRNKVIGIVLTIVGVIILTM